MPKEAFIFIGAIAGAIVAYITTIITVRTQVRIAKLNADKDLKLQTDRLDDERLKTEVQREREELKKLHLLLSRVALETSQTVSHIQSVNSISPNEFHNIYLENCHLLHEARAISDLYYPEMSEAIGKVYGQSNLFWGYQKSVLRIDIKENAKGWHQNMTEVLKSGKEVSTLVDNLHYQISARGRELNATLNPVCC